MGVYIKGVEMPTSEEKCKFFQSAPFRAPYCVINGVCGGLEDCPIVPVPPHGRLIDADALMLEIQEYIEEYGWETDEHGWHNEKWCAMKEAAMAIDAAPTIIPAEEGE